MEDDLKKLDRKVGVSSRNRRYIVFTVFIALFFVTVIILEAIHIIPVTARRILIGTMIGFIAVWYFIAKKKHR